MAATPVHMGAGIGIGILARMNPLGYLLALWTHIILDDLNVDPITSWYHGYGDGGWRTWLYVAWTGIVGGLMGALLIVRAPHLIGYVVCACLPDIEHPIRLLKGKKGYWLHHPDVMFPAVLRGQWGMMAWSLIMAWILVIEWKWFYP